MYYRQAIEGGQSIFPEMYNLEWLLRKQQQDPYNFALQWMNNPLDQSVAEFRRDQLHYYTRGDGCIILPNGEQVPLGQIDVRCDFAGVPRVLIALWEGS